MTDRRRRPPRAAVWLAWTAAAAGCGGAGDGAGARSADDARPGFDPAAQAVVHLGGPDGAGAALPTGRFLVGGVQGRTSDDGAVVWSAGLPALAARVDAVAFLPGGGVTALAEGVVVHAPSFDAPFAIVGRLPDRVGPDRRGPRPVGGPLLVTSRADGRRHRVDAVGARLVPLPPALERFEVLAMPDPRTAVGRDADGGLWAWTAGEDPRPLEVAHPGNPWAVGDGDVWLVPTRRGPGAPRAEEGAAPAGPVRLDPATGATTPVEPPEEPTPASRGFGPDALPGPTALADGTVVSIRGPALLRHDPVTLEVLGEARPPTFADGRCALKPRGAGLFARCLHGDRGDPDGLRARFHRVSAEGDAVEPLPLGPLAAGTTIDAVLTEDGSALYWQGTCAEPAGWGDVDEVDAIVYDENGDPVGDTGAPWCVVPAAGGAAFEVTLPRHLGPPAGLVGAAGGDAGAAPEAWHVVGRAGRDALWLAELRPGAASADTTPDVRQVPAPGAAGEVDTVHVQPDGTVVALASAFDRGDDPRAEPTMRVSAHRARLAALLAGAPDAWTPLPLPASLRGVAFAPDGRGALAVVEGGLLGTTDGGVTWTPLPLPLATPTPRAFTRTVEVRCGPTACGPAGIAAGPPFLVVGRGADARAGRGVLLVNRRTDAPVLPVAAP